MSFEHILLTPGLGNELKNRRMYVSIHKKHSIALAAFEMLKRLLAEGQWCPSNAQTVKMISLKGCQIDEIVTNLSHREEPVKVLKTKAGVGRSSPSRKAMLCTQCHLEVF